MSRMFSKLSFAVMTVTLIFLWYTSILFVRSLPLQSELWEFILYMVNTAAWGHVATSLLYYRRVTRILEKELGDPARSGDLDPADAMPGSERVPD